VSRDLKKEIMRMNIAIEEFCDNCDNWGQVFKLPSLGDNRDIYGIDVSLLGGVQS
jgi:hypothetical protein